MIKESKKFLDLQSKICISEFMGFCEDCLSPVYFPGVLTEVWYYRFIIWALITRDTFFYSKCKLDRINENI